MRAETTMRARGWALFDAIVADAAARDRNPWSPVGFTPDLDTLRTLLGVPVALAATSQSGVPALALDVWLAYELRRAGFDPDAVWPRSTRPRVLSEDVAAFFAALPPALRRQLVDQLAHGGDAARIMGKNYVKQVDVVMSSWATGPQLLISTKRMDSSYGKNAANRVEESYGDAKNLRLRHPQAALGFVFALSADALLREPDTVEWLIDLLIKLGREDDAYDAVALLLPRVGPPDEVVAVSGEPSGGAADPPPEYVEDGLFSLTQVTPGPQAAPPRPLRQVGLCLQAVPAELDPARFLQVMCTKVLDASPVTMHTEARRRRRG